MNHGWCTVLLAAAAMALGPGCNRDTQVIDASTGAPREVGAVPDLVGMSRPPIPDVPVPINFDLDEDCSRNYTLGSGRIVDHTYRGRAEKAAVKQFYDRHMTIQRWALVSWTFVTGEITLDYEKENERCRIVINEGGWGRPVKVRITIMTSARLQPYPGPKPNN